MSIPWLPIFTTGATLLGSLFGNQKNTNQTENSNTTGTTKTAGTQGLTSSTTQNQQQTQNSSQSSNQSSAEKIGTTNQQVGTTKRLDATTLDSLTAAVQKVLAGGTVGAGGDAAASRLQEVQSNGTSFDADAYVKGIMESTQSRLASDLESGGNQIASKTGASGRTNSATALLQAKLNRAGAAELAGVNSQAIATAADIKRQEQESKTGQITSLAAQTDSQVGNLLSALLGAGETTSQAATGTQDTTGVTSGTTTGTTTTTGKTTESTQQQQVTAQGVDSTQNVTGKISNNEGSTNWSDFFTNIGKIFSTSF